MIWCGDVISTNHAVERFRERVNCVGDRAVRRMIRQDIYGGGRCPSLARWNVTVSDDSEEFIESSDGKRLFVCRWLNPKRLMVVTVFHSRSPLRKSK